MRAELGLPSVRGDDDKGGGMMGGFGGSMGGVGGGKSKRPIQVKFEIPYFTTSGIQVRYLKIIEPKVRIQYFFHKQSLFARIDSRLTLSIDDHRCVELVRLYKSDRIIHNGNPELLNVKNRTNTDIFIQLQYPSLPWVRYITQSGDIAVRLPEVQR